jgi:hypothetical protein
MASRYTRAQKDARYEALINPRNGLSTLRDAYGERAKTSDQVPHAARPQCAGLRTAPPSCSAHAS